MELRPATAAAPQGALLGLPVCVEHTSRQRLIRRAVVLGGLAAGAFAVAMIAGSGHASAAAPPAPPTGLGALSSPLTSAASGVQSAVVALVPASPVTSSPAPEHASVTKAVSPIASTVVTPVAHTVDVVTRTVPKTVAAPVSKTVADTTHAVTTTLAATSTEVTRTVTTATSALADSPLVKVTPLTSTLVPVVVHQVLNPAVSSTNSALTGTVGALDSTVVTTLSTVDTTVGQTVATIDSSFDAALDPAASALTPVLGSSIDHSILTGTATIVTDAPAASLADRVDAFAGVLASARTGVTQAGRTSIAATSSARIAMTDSAPSARVAGGPDQPAAPAPIAPTGPALAAAASGSSGTGRGSQFESAGVLPIGIHDPALTALASFVPASGQLPVNVGFEPTVSPD